MKFSALGGPLKNWIEFTYTVVGQASSLPFFGKNGFSVQRIWQARCLPHFFNGLLGGREGSQSFTDGKVQYQSAKQTEETHDNEDPFLTTTCAQE